MYNGKTVIALIPARGGSKSIPAKNLQMLGNRRLLQWPIDTARAIAEIDRTLVSTNCPEIAAAAIAGGAEVHDRPDNLAHDRSLVIDTIRHVYKQLTANGNPPDIMLLLEATCPFRTPDMIRACLKRLEIEAFDSVATFSKLDIPAERIWKIDNDVAHPLLDNANPWLPRQMGTDVYKLNGAVYAFRPGKILNDTTSILFGHWAAEITDETNIIDIDNEEDLRLANALLTI